MWPSGGSVEEAPGAGLQLRDDFRRVVDERPGQFLVIEELSAREGVVEVRLQRVERVEYGVVSTLHHAGAPRPAHSTLADDGDVEIRVSVMNVHHAHQASATAADDGNVCVDLLEAAREGHRPPIRPVRRARIACAGSSPFGQTPLQP